MGKIPVIEAFSDTQNVEKQTRRNRMRKNFQESLPQFVWETTR